jgi:hypothetical protein
MKILRQARDRPVKEERRPSRASRIAVMAFAGLTALTAPKLINTADAQPVTTKEAAEESILTVNGETTTLTGEEGSRDVYVVSRQLDHHPVAEVEGPATLTIRFYPAVLREWFGEEGQEVSRTIRYRMENGEEGREQVFSGETALSRYTSPDIPESIMNESTGVMELNPLAVGTAIEGTVPIPEGRHQLTIIAPNGLVEFEAERRMVVRPEPRVEPPPRPPPREVEPRPEPETPEAPQETRARLAFGMEGDRTHLHSIGPSEVPGDLNNVVALADVRIGEHLGLVAGAAFTSYGLMFTSEEIDADIRSFNGSLIIGPSLALGSHRLYAAAMLGYNGVFADTFTPADGIIGRAEAHLFDYGAELGYSYGRWIRLRVAGGSNSIVPLSAHLYGALPFSWSREAYPWAQLDAFWLHAPTPFDAEAGQSVLLSENNFLGRLTLGIPIWGIGAGRGVIIPTVLVAGDINLSGEGFHRADLQLGGALAATAGGFEIQAAAAASPLTATPFFLLRIGYNR